MVSGRARAVVVGVGSNTAMGGIRDAMLRTEDVSICFLMLPIFQFVRPLPLFYILFQCLIDSG